MSSLDPASGSKRHGERGSAITEPIGSTTDLVGGHGNPGYTLSTYAHALPREARDLAPFRGLFRSRMLYTAWVQDREN